MKQQLRAHIPQRCLQKVLLPHGDAAGGHHQVGLPAQALQRGGKRGFVIACGLRPAVRAQLVQPGGEIGGVDVVDLSRRQRLPRRTDLVPGGQYRRPGAAPHREYRKSGTGGSRRGRGIHPLTCGQQTFTGAVLLAPANAVGPGGKR